ncbi:MAG: hypothetical protein PVI86_13420 [Phycisphaerae bacterium]|jgi:hypothetical protein
MCEKLNSILVTPKYGAPGLRHVRQSHSYALSELTAKLGSNRGTHGLVQLREIVPNGLQEPRFWFGKEDPSGFVI